MIWTRRTDKYGCTSYACWFGAGFVKGNFSQVAANASLQEGRPIPHNDVASDAVWVLLALFIMQTALPKPDLIPIP